MDNNQLKSALISGEEVVYKSQHGNITYTVSGIIYRRKGNGISVYAELMDKSKRSVTIASVGQIYSKE